MRALAVVLACGLVYGFFGACSAPPEIAVGVVAPELSVEALDGSDIELDAFEGEIVVVNFWATWCQPCRKEFPVLNEIDDRPGVTVLAVSLDEGGPSVVEAFAEREGLDYIIGIGSQELFESYDGLVIPYTLVLDRDRTIVALYRGPVERERIEEDIAGIG
jgi:thiol-disulfide isomerase/thioredoxin